MLHRAGCKEIKHTRRGTYGKILAVLVAKHLLFLFKKRKKEKNKHFS